MPDYRWYTTLAGREQGPFDPAQMRALIAQGRIAAETPVRREDMAQAVLAGNVRGLLPPPAAAVSETESYSAPPAPRVTSAVHRNPPAKAMSGGPAAAVRPSLARRGGGGAGSDQTPEPASAILVAAGRAAPRRRIVAALIDVVLLGGAAVALVVMGLRAPGAAGEHMRQEIEAARSRQSAAQTANGGEGRPSFAAWPGVEDQWVASVARTRAALAEAEAAVKQVALATQATPTAAPTHDQEVAALTVANLHNELDFRQRSLEFERTKYQQDAAAVALVEARAGVTRTLFVSLGLVLLLILPPVIEVLGGGTPGKLLLGLRAVGPGRRPIGFLAAFIRHGARFVPGSQLGLGGPAALAWHDRWSATEVVERTAVVRRAASGRRSRPA